MLKLNTALRVQVCCCLWVSIGAAERSPGSVAEFDFGFLLFVVARLGMSFSASSYQNECGVWSGNLFNAMLARNMRKSSWQYSIARGCSSSSRGGAAALAVEAGECAVGLLDFTMP